MYMEQYMSRIKTENERQSKPSKNAKSFPFLNFCPVSVSISSSIEQCI